MWTIKGTNVQNLQTNRKKRRITTTIKTAAAFFLFFILLFLTLIDGGSAMKCFRCEVTLEQYYDNDVLVTTPMCLKFDKSNAYIIECPYSTMCLKTISTFTLNNGQKHETVTRGCAQQKNSTEVFRNRTWHTMHSVQEVYSEGCMSNMGNNLVGAALTYCYCRGDLCNASSRAFDGCYLLPLATTVIILAKMYLKTSL